MKRNKVAINVNQAQRVSEFGKETFCVEGGLLWCRICDVPVDHIRKQTISDHVASAKHTAKNSKRKSKNDDNVAPKRQATITGMHERVTEASAAKEKLVLNLVEAFMSANIPLEKLDNPKMREFLDTSVKGGGGVPTANWLRERYVPKLYALKQEEIKQRLKGQKVAVIADETNDAAGRYVVNVLMQPLDAFADSNLCQALLVNTEFLEQVNNTTMAQTVIRSITDMGVDFNDVLAFVSDNAAYMKKCFADGLKGILPNAVHITCWAHIVFLVGEQFRDALTLTDNLLATVKSLFSKAPGRRARYLCHLRQQGAVKVSLPSSPVVTRWNTWFEAALYHGEHLDYYASFVQQEIEQCSTIQMKKFSSLLEEPRVNILRAELDFLAVHCERLIRVLKSLQSREVRAVSIYYEITDLLSWLRNPGLPYATNTCEEAMTNAAAKLSEYVEGTKQPAIDLFKSIRMFEHKQLPLLSREMSDFNIPLLSVAADEWQIYLDVVARESVCEDTLSFWNALADRLPKLSALARAYLAIPVSSVDVERSFSKYGSVLSPLRLSLARENLKAYCSVFYNNS